MYKKLFIVILSLLLITGSILPVYATDTTAELLNIYSDGMLFQQLKPAVIEGVATSGSSIKAELRNDKNEIITRAEATAADGRFILEFTSPAGEYSEYSIVFYENNKVFETLDNIVFGELWLASGQSNMQYPLLQSVTGKEMYNSNKRLSPWLRVLLVPAYPEYKGVTNLVPSEPQKDITDAVWVNGENESIYSMSAVAYFFAEKLMQDLDMPVGILNSSLGGSTIRSWLSRSAIDSDENVKNYLISCNQYINSEDWNEAEQSIYYDMTANYNQKIAPLKNFRPNGMIWYQGESDLVFSNTQYDKQFDLMQQSYSELFGYNNSLLPIIYTQLASYYYSDDGLVLSDWNMNYTEMQKTKNNSRAMITISDIPLTYLPEAGLIHPEHKEEIGERMAFSALGLVYGYYDSYTAPSFSNYEINGNSIYIDFSDTGDGIICTENKIKGFAICAEDMKYVDANAEIIDSDTVRVWSDYIEKPYAVSYAYGVSNQDANLFSSIENKATLPVSVFRTNTESSCEWFSMPWMYCDNEFIWFTEDDKSSGYYDAWNSKNAEISVDALNCLENGFGIGINAFSKCFSVSPTLSYKSGISNTVFKDAQTDYSSFGTISFLIRNNGTDDVVFEGMRFYKNAVSWYTPAVKGTLDNKTVIPADGKTYTITLDLNKLYYLDNQCTLSYSSEKLQNINALELRFSSKSKNSNISIDSFNFGPSDNEKSVGYEVDLGTADSIFEMFTGIFLKIFEMIRSLFD